MNCYTHAAVPAVGVCAICGRAVCHDCVAVDSPRVVCASCRDRGAVHGFEYRSAAEFAGLPWIHICSGTDPLTQRPRVAKGVIAIGNIAVGGFACGGLALGLVTFGGLSVGLIAAIGGAALGLGISLGGVAVGSVALGGLAVGFAHAIGGGAFAPHVISGTRCDQETVDFLARWIGRNVPSCR